MTQPPMIREMIEADLDLVVCLWRDAGLTRPWNDPFADAALALAAPSSTILVASVEGQLAGSVMVGFDGHRGWVYYLAVAAPFRRQDVGRRVMQAAETWLQARSVPKVQLMVRADNMEVAAFYRALGYSPEPVAVLSRWF